MTERKLFFLGRTKWEVTRNVAGLLILLGFLAAKYCTFNTEHVLRIEIPSETHGLKSLEEFRRAFAGFKLNAAHFLTVADQINKTPEEVWKLVNIDLDFRHPDKLVVECVSTLAQDVVAQVCAAAEANVRDYLKKN